MTTHSITKTPADDLDDMICAYRQSLEAPLDGMWQHFTRAAEHYAIKKGPELVGYCAVDAENRLLQLSLVEGVNARQVFEDMLEDLKPLGAVLASFETAALALALDQQRSVAVNAFLYALQQGTAKGAPLFPKGAVFEKLEKADLEDAVAFAYGALGADEAWLRGYLADLIQKGELYGLRLDGDIVATGECRVSETQKPFADVGMVVGPSYRGQGIATNILRALIAVCKSKGLEPICSTERANIAAQKAIERAGFTSRHRMLEIEF